LFTLSVPVSLQEREKSSVLICSTLNESKFDNCSLQSRYFASSICLESNSERFLTRCVFCLPLFDDTIELAEDCATLIGAAESSVIISLLLLTGAAVLRF